jgi:spore germination protein
MHYTVQEGDTLWLVAQRYRSDYRMIALANSLEEPYEVHPGQVLHIPRKYRLIGFIADYASTDGIADALRAPEPFSEVVYSFLHIQPNGDLHLGAQDPAVQLIRARRTRVLAGVTNLSEAAYSPQSADAALLAEDTRSMLAGRIVEVASSNFLDGVHLDFQRISCAHWDALAILAREIRAGFASLSPNYTLSVTIPHDWAKRAFNLGCMAECVDLMMLEGLEKGSDDPEGPPTSLAWLRKNVESALEYVNRSKLAATIGVYGLDWGAGGEVAYITSDAAARAASETGAHIVRDADSAAAWFEYCDSCGEQHKVWYEDLVTLSAKIRALDSLGVRKIALWRLGAVPAAVLEAASGAWGFG